MMDDPLSEKRVMLTIAEYLLPEMINHSLKDTLPGKMHKKRHIIASLAKL